MNLNFETQRLSVQLLVDPKQISSQQILHILTDEVTKYLPPTWQGLTDAESTDAWLDDRIKDGNLYLLQSKTTQRIIGFLFIDGLAQGLEPMVDDNELRVGYVLSEEVWGKGVASELIQSMIQNLEIMGCVKPLLAGVVPANIGSAKVLTKNGFVWHHVADGIDFYEYRRSRVD